MRWLVRFYPQKWRERYEQEFVALLEQVPHGPRMTVDVVIGGLLARLAPPPAEPPVTLEPAGGTDLKPTFQPVGRQTAFALAGLVLVAPTVSFLSLAVLKYWMGVDAPFDATQAVFLHPVVEPLTVAGPFLAFLASTWPVVHVRLGWEQGALSGELEWRARPLNLAVSALSAGLIVVLLVYFLIENF
jgi:hypothetical protein